MLRTARYWAAAIALFAALGTARADTYYVIVFGAESKPPRPKYSHSWAVFVHFPGCGPCGPPAPDAGPPEWFTISWLPCKVEMTVNTPCAEPGRNFDLPTTFDIALSQWEHVTAFGPYQIEPELYCRALKQKQRLESGEVRYKTIDWFRDPHRVSNCIHALTSFNPENRRVRIGRTNFGDTASYWITVSYTDWIICTKRVHCWVADVLGLGQYPIQWKTLEEGPPPLFR
ncbi:MAG TPA: hypothetical protein VGF55_07580 [Gemmataceae bacterium]